MVDLIGARWILPRSNAHARPAVDGFFRRAGESPPLACVETGDATVISRLLGISDMLAVVSSHQIEAEIRAGTVVELPVTIGETERDLGIILRDGGMQSRAVLEVVEAVTAQSSSARRTGRAGRKKLARVGKARRAGVERI
jgi:LysR family transcriptional regulator of gallate degradation